MLKMNQTKGLALTEFSSDDYRIKILFRQTSEKQACQKDSNARETW